MKLNKRRLEYKHLIMRVDSADKDFFKDLISSSTFHNNLSDVVNLIKFAVSTLTLVCFLENMNNQNVDGTNISEIEMEVSKILTTPTSNCNCNSVRSVLQKNFSQSPWHRQKSIFLIIFCILIIFWTISFIFLNKFGYF